MGAFVRKYGVATTIDGVPLLELGTDDYKANPTLAAGDVQVSKDGGAFANLATIPAVTPASGRAVRVALSATEMQAARLVIQFVDQTSPKEWADQFVLVETYGHASAQRQDWDQTGDSFARLGAPAGASVSADVAAVKSDTAATLVDTAEIGAAGAGLTALAQASVCTAARLAELDAANLPADVAAVAVDAALASDLLEGDEEIDKTTNPSTWQQVVKRKATATVLARKNLFQSDGTTAIDADGDVVGKRVEP